MNTLPEIEAILCAALDEKVAAGAEVMRNDGGNGRTCGCALSLWAGLSDGYQKAANEVFGWSWRQSGAFIGGFDGDDDTCTRAFPEIAELGRKLARKYVDKVNS
jgi:hypothetical protein